MRRALYVDDRRHAGDRDPSNANLMVYSPGLRSMNRYCPAPSVVASLVPSIIAGLEIVTATPGSTASDASLTVPAMELWASAAVGCASRHPITKEASQTAGALRTSLT